MDNSLKRWERQYREAQEAGEQPFSLQPHPLVVQALDRVRILTRHRPSAIDVGAGTGRHARELARRGYYVLAVEGTHAAADLRPDMPAAEDTSIEWARADAYHWDPPYKVDVVLVAFFHEREHGIMRLLPRLKTWLTEGGWLVMVGHSRQQVGRDVGGPPHADALWDLEQMRKWMSEEGFEIADHREVEHLGKCRDNAAHTHPRKTGGQEGQVPASSEQVGTSSSGSGYGAGAADQVGASSSGSGPVAGATPAGLAVTSILVGKHLG
ncbi:MAG: class I SAM-dependent methyltransferase [Actinomycetaceae bacterium]|nr:class I SAM-dependent methyltransferase [Actinomycetaceae bacterium]